MDVGEQTSDRCVICLESFEASNKAVCEDNSEAKHISRCGHATHKHCLHSSIRSGNYTCPVCRQPLGDTPLSDAGIVKGDGAPMDKAMMRYANMLRSKLPVAAVRQRMVVDGVSPAAIDAFFTGGMSQEVISAEDDISANIILNVDLAQYRKMLRLGLCEAAVRQKLVTAGVPEHQAEDVLLQLYSQEDTVPLSDSKT
jgi:hypothetical protein